MASEGGPSTQRFKQEFLGRYLLQRELGRGGMAVVYEAVDTSLGRRVAVKVLHSRPEQTPEQMKVDEERFLREARLAGALPKHPNIVGVHDAATHRERRYIVMELVDGRPFGDWRRETTPPMERQVEVLRDVARAVHHAHEHGVVHRDLKPGNILIDGEGRPHVTDFGLAMLDNGGSLSLTAEGLTVGTPGYMSPEQAQGLRSVDRRTDIYSLGSMLYESIAGRPPYEGDSAIAILTQVIRDPVKAPSTIIAGRPLTSIDIELEKICLHAMEKDVEQRTPTAKAFAEELSAWLARKAKPAEPAPARSAPLWLWMLPGLLVLGAAAIAAFRGGPRPAPEPAPTLVRVPATQAWTETGLDVREGEALLAVAEGTWSNHEGSQARVSAAGRERLIGTPYEHYTRGWPVPEGPLMALVARIGPEGVPWVLPPGRPVRLPSSGRLWLGPNDSPLPADNGGELAVTLRGRAASPGDSRIGLAVPGAATWTDTGIDVEPGDILQFLASGQWSKAPNAKQVGPAGESAPAVVTMGFPVPEARVMALVGRIGPTGVPWLVPLKEPLRVSASGRLFLGPNDHPADNNTGALRVSILR